MTSSLTDRYVSATVRSLDDEQRAEVERELRTTIEDMIDGRLQAGAPSRPDAEREVLVELGDPVRLAAGYSGRPLYLIGQASLWVVVLTALVSAADYFRRFNDILAPRVADFSSGRDQQSDRKAG